MLRTIDLRNSPRADLGAALPRAAVDVGAALEAVRPVIADVRERGTLALEEYAVKYDGVKPPHLRVPQQALIEALENLDPSVRSALETAASHMRAGHGAQMPRETVTQIVEGGYVHQRWVPVARVGLYVPGGLAVYPSSVVMNAVAAQVAGVEQLVITSPPQARYGGLPHPVILAAAQLLGVTEVYAAGGAQAVAMLAYGASDPRSGQLVCPPVDVITGPGNIYVAAAKRAVAGQVGIDSEAGTTEIAILADSGANPTYVAWDLISQAEHDPAAASVLVTDSVDVAQAVKRELGVLVGQTKHSERIEAALGGPQSAVVLVDDLEAGIALCDAYGAEHLEIHTADPLEVAKRVRCAGAIFAGPYSPVPLGDYMAGSNHVLPTGGTARFASGLSVMAYLKPVQVVDYTRAALDGVTDDLVALARSEDLPAHGQCVVSRREGLGL